jgi:hypothetical protein
VAARCPTQEDAVPADDPSGIGTDRALVERIEDGEVAVLLVGPGRVGLHLPVEDLPPEAEVGTWVVLDVQSQPPLVLGIDEDLTAEGP